MFRETLKALVIGGLLITSPSATIEPTARDATSINDSQYVVTYKNVAVVDNDFKKRLDDLRDLREALANRLWLESLRFQISRTRVGSAVSDRRSTEQDARRTESLFIRLNRAACGRRAHDVW